MRKLNNYVEDKGKIKKRQYRNFALLSCCSVGRKENLFFLMWYFTEYTKLHEKQITAVIWTRNRIKLKKILHLLYSYMTKITSQIKCTYLKGKSICEHGADLQFLLVIFISAVNSNMFKQKRMIFSCINLWKMYSRAMKLLPLCVLAWFGEVVQVPLEYLTRKSIWELEEFQSKKQS